MLVATVTTPTLPTGRECGFTLIELIVVMLIMATIVGLALPRFRQPAMTLELQASLVIDQFAIARRAAVASGELQALSQDELDQVLEADFRIAAQPLAGGKLAKSVIFYPAGHSNGGQWLLFDDDRRLIIEVDWLTGLARQNSSE